MFKSILMAAAAALVATAAVVPAHAGVFNGASLNGASLNGSGENGASLNGGGENGIGPNIRSHQGTSTGATGFVIDGIELPAQVR